MQDRQFSNMNFTAALLAGGASRRMGRDKSTIVIDGEPLWQRQLRTLLATDPAELLISGRPTAPYASTAVVIEDETPGCGPLGGVATLLARATHPFVLVLAVDLPAMTAEFLHQLVGSAIDQRSALALEIDGRFEPLAAVYTRDCLPIARRSLAKGELAMQAFLHQLATSGLLQSRVALPAERPFFRNLNRPADLPEASDQPS
jgi:molybdopterin-guanine dinucleotide biosynthesis protein A